MKTKTPISTGDRLFAAPPLKFLEDGGKTRAEAYVCFAGIEDERARRIGGGLPEEVTAAADRWLAHPKAFDAKRAEIALLPIGEDRLCALAGVGPIRTLAARDLGRAAAAAARALARRTPRAVAFSLDWGADAPDLPLETAARRLAAGAVEGEYRFARYHSRPSPVFHPELIFIGPATREEQVRRAIREGAIEGATLNQIADLANLPGNAATPEFIAESARRLARETGLSCRIYDAAALRKERCEALLAVGAGSRRAPRIIVLRYAGSGKAARGQRPIALVGKTLTFDSGGISLKPGAGMEWMRYDKCGGMAVLAAMAAAARLGLPIPIVGILAAAENMPDGGAARPGDVVRTRSGKTVEILNTDAEGRLVLADALSLAADFKPSATVDLATLTGAARTALGVEASALCTEDDNLAAELTAAGEASGDRCWRLPLWPEYDEMLKSSFADLKNIGDGSAGAIAGAAFLKAFAPSDAPWAHLDIAATAWLEKDAAHRAAGATLSGARLLIEWLRRRAAVTSQKGTET